MQKRTPLNRGSILRQFIGGVQTFPANNYVDPATLTPKKDSERVIMEDKNTGNLVSVVTQYDDTGVVLGTTYTDLVTGATWTGNPHTDLITPISSEIESDPIQMCDGGSTGFIRWVTKKDGVPYGTSIDTTMNGVTAYTPTGSVTMGACAVKTSLKYQSVCFKDSTGAKLAGVYYEIIDAGSTGTGVSLGYVQHTTGTGYVAFTAPAGYTATNDCCGIYAKTQNPKVLEGRIVDSVVGGSVTYTFTDAVSNISITNATNGICIVTLVNSIPTLGNNTMPVGPSEAYQLESNNSTDTFTAITITDINSSSIGKYLIRGTRF